MKVFYVVPERDIVLQLTSVAMEDGVARAIRQPGSKNTLHKHRYLQIHFLHQRSLVRIIASTTLQKKDFSKYWMIIISVSIIKYYAALNYDPTSPKIKWSTMFQGCFRETQHLSRVITVGDLTSCWHISPSLSRV